MRVRRVILDVVGTILIALLLLGGWFSITGGGFPEAFRVLFNFMDVGLGLWAVLLIVFTVTSSVSARRAYLLLGVGALVNLLVVITVGFIQTGGWAGELILFAVEAGVACLIGGAITIPVAHRRRAADSSSTQG